MGSPLTPLASLCLGVVRGWINVARRKQGGIIDEEGNAWTRLPAEQLRDQLETEFMVEVSTRSVQRALKELSDGRHIRREQRWKHRYNRDYWYSIPQHEVELNQHRPRVIQGNYNHQSVRRRPRSHSETTRATGHVLSTPTTNTLFSEQPSIERKTNSGHRTPPTSNRGREQPEQGRTPIWAKSTITDGLKELRSICEGYGKQPPSRITSPLHPALKPEEFAGYDHDGRQKKRVWVGGVEHLVVD